MSRQLLLGLLFAATASAHEIGTSRVSVLLRGDSTYDVELVTDATALAEKLLVSDGKPSQPPAGAPRLQALLESYDAQFRQRAKLTFDNGATRPETSYSVEPPINDTSASAATIHLKGAIPPGARQFTWTFGWTFASYALTIRRSPTEEPATVWLEGGDSSAPIALARAEKPSSRLATALRYLKLGFTHILPHGFDHMLFVLGIYLLSTRWRSVLAQVSAFTVAHSITLGLSMYGVLTISPRIVEPMIAISIAYVAIENIFLAELKSWRIVLVFCFGLLHGMGFAGALKELGLPRSEFLTALVTFNVGVEGGQLAVIAMAFLLVGWHWSQRVWYRTRVVLPASAIIACTAVYWTAARLA
jgi:hydrogenase/urease accessory protein HupE